MEDVSFWTEPKGSLLGNPVDELEIDHPGADKGTETPYCEPTMYDFLVIPTQPSGCNQLARDWGLFYPALSLPGEVGTLYRV
jgi:hypothetical protein